MATSAKAAGTQVIGKAFIVYGTVKAIAPDGTVRILGPNSEIYADERIVTESDGGVSLMLDGPPPSQIDIGRMSDVLMNEDVYAGAPPEAVTDASADAEKIQEALEGQGDIEIDATAAGAGGAGGGMTLVQFGLDGSEGNVTSGAETTGYTQDTVEPLDALTSDTVPVGGKDDMGAVDEDGLTEGNFGGPGDHPAVDSFITGNMTYDFGADGPAAVNPFVWSTDGLADLGVTSQGHELLYEVSGDGLTLTAYYLVEGKYEVFDSIGEDSGGRVDVFSVTVTDVTTGAYTFTLYQPLDHTVAGTEDDIVYNFTYTLTDGDGSTGTGSLGMTIDDDSPVLYGGEDQGSGSDTVMVEDEKMQDFWGRLATDEHDGGVSHVNGSIVDNVHWGADGFGSATVITVGGEEFEIPVGSSTTLYWAQDGTFLGTNMGEDSGDPAASLQVNSDGTYTYTLLDNLLLGSEIQGEQIDELATVSITGVDYDGDPAAVNVTLQVQDDMPFCITVPDIVIAEDSATMGTGVDILNGTIVNNALWGADGFGEAATFTVDGQTFDADTTVYWDQYGNFLGTNMGEDSVDPAASMIVNSDGTYTYTLLENMLMGQGDQGEQINLLDRVTITAEDADGDKVNIDVYLKVQDDTPCINLRAVNESSVVLTTYDAETIGDDFDTAISTANFGGVFQITSASFGADGPGGTSMSYSLNLAHMFVKDSGLNSNGSDINLYKVGNDIIGSTATKSWNISDSNTVFKLGVDGEGKVTLTQFQEIDHANNNDTSAPYNDQFAELGSGFLGLGLVKLTGSATITDADGDRTTDNETIDLGGNIRFADDGPSVSVNNAVMVDDDDVAGADGNAGGTGDDAPAFTSGTLGHDFGADGAGSITYLTTGAPEGFTYVKSGDNLLVKQGDTTVMTLTLNTSNGEYAVTQNAPIDHAPGADENNQEFTINYQVKDGDGDKAFGTLTISVDDDTPVAVDDYDTATVGMDGKTYNLLLILDTSGSMSQSELQQEVSAMKSLLDKYGEIAEGGPDGVKVQIVSFATGATLYHGEPVSITDAKTLLDTLDNSGGSGSTNYDAAVAQATAAIDDSYGGAGWPAADADHANVVYFVSDGEANIGTISDAEEILWHSTLGDVGATAYAIGVGTSGSGWAEDLADIAFPDANVILVSDFNGLLNSLEGTIVSPTVDGNVLDNDSLGADDGSVTAISYIDVDGNPASAAVPDSGEVTVHTQLGALTIDADGHYEYTATPLDALTSHITVNLSNTDLGTGIGAGGLVHITVEGPGANPDLINNDGAFGIASADGGDGGRYDEINYLGNGQSEVMKFELQDGKIATSATVEVTEFYKGGESERGYYELFKGGVLVENSHTEFAANNSNGNLTLQINGPASGFDEIRFGALQDTNASGGDNSDYSVKSITFDLATEAQSDVFTYTVTDGDFDTDTATLTIDINTLIDDPNDNGPA